MYVLVFRKLLLKIAQLSTEQDELLWLHFTWLLLLFLFALCVPWSLDKSFWRRFRAGPLAPLCAVAIHRLLRCRYGITDPGWMMPGPIGVNIFPFVAIIIFAVFLSIWTWHSENTLTRSTRFTCFSTAQTSTFQQNSSKHSSNISNKIVHFAVLVAILWLNP